MRPEDTALAERKREPGVFPTDLGEDNGLLLRDYFAAKILQGFAGNPAIFAPNPSCGWSLVNATDADICGYAYKLADDMVAAREGTK